MFVDSILVSLRLFIYFLYRQLWLPCCCCCTLWLNVTRADLKNLFYRIGWSIKPITKYFITLKARLENEISRRKCWRNNKITYFVSNDPGKCRQSAGACHYISILLTDIPLHSICSFVWHLFRFYHEERWCKFCSCSI